MSFAAELFFRFFFGFLHFAGHGDKPDGHDITLVKIALFVLDDQNQILKASRTAVGQDHSSTRLELLDQRFRDTTGGSSADDRIKRGMLRPAKIPIAGFGEYIPVAQLL